MQEFMQLLNPQKITPFICLARVLREAKYPAQSINLKNNPGKKVGVIIASV